MLITSEADLNTVYDRSHDYHIWIPNATTVVGNYYNVHNAITPIINGQSIAFSKPAANTVGGTLYNNDSSFLTHHISSADTGYIVEAVHKVSTNNETLFIQDRLWACSGFITTTTGAQQITAFPTLPSRYDQTSNTAVLWVEILTTMTVTTPTITITYTDSNNVSGKTATVVLPTNPTVGMMFPVNLSTATVANAKDNIKSIQQVTCGTVGTAGEFGLVLTKPLTSISTIRNEPYPVARPSVANKHDYSMLGLPKIVGTCTPMIIMYPATTSSGDQNLCLTIGC